MRRTRTRMFVRSAFAVSLALSLAGGSVASAAETDRIAIEARAGESPMETALAYEDACFRIGVTPQQLWPVRKFQLDGDEFVRLSIAGDSLVLRCLNGLNDRDAIDGTEHWTDGPPRGLLVRVRGKSAAEPETVTDDRWYSAGEPVAIPKPSMEFVDHLATGSPEARGQLAKMPLEEALPSLANLATERGPKVPAVLERIATDDSRWSIRRFALQYLDPVVSAAVILDRAAHDPSWEVRLGAVSQVARLATYVGPRAQEATEEMRRLALKDSDWTVRRQAIWQMPRSLAIDVSDGLLATVRDTKLDARLRAIALETLAGVGNASDVDVRIAFGDSAPEVRAIAAEILVSRLRAETAPMLWTAMHDTARLVRLAAAPFLYGINDDTISPQLWTMYEAEADRLDADADFERALLDFLSRHPDPALSGEISTRLRQKSTPPFERRLLSRALAAIAPDRARALLQPELANPDPILRSIAVDAVPDSPPVRAQRKALLEDPDSDVRAAALLGLCRAKDSQAASLADDAELEATPLKKEAEACLFLMGKPVDHASPIRTSLGNPEAPEPVRTSPVWPAVIGMLLILASFVASRLVKRGA